MLSRSGGNMAQSMTARFAQADSSINQPATGRYHTAVVTMTYTHNTWICHQTSPFHSELPIEARARIDRMKAAINAVTLAAAKYTSGMMIMPTNSLHSTVVASDPARASQNRMLRSFRSVYRQSSKYQAAYSAMTRENMAPTTTKKAAAASSDCCCEGGGGILT